MKIDSDIKKLTVSQTNLAKALNLSVRRERIGQLVQEKVVVRDDSDPTGGVFLFDSLRSYYMKQADKSGDDYFKIKAQHEEVKKQLSEVKLRQLEGELIEVDEVDAALADILVTLRTNLLSMPAKFSTQLEGKDRAEIYKILTAEIEDKLQELSNLKAEDL